MKILFLLLSLNLYALSIDTDAPNFTLMGADNKEYKLSELRGKTVVLEWLNHGCPFIKKHYDAKNMQTMQKKYTDKGVVWLSVISSAPGKQGHSSPEKALEDKKEKGAFPSAILLDPKGEVGRKYAAKTTPHMYVINKEGKLVYQGAIDSIPSADPSDIAESKNYVQLALDSVLANKAVAIKSTKPYGCSVKYN